MTNINDEIEYLENVLKDSKDADVLRLTSRIKHLEDATLRNEPALRKLKRILKKRLEEFFYSRPLLRLEYLKEAKNLVDSFNRPLSLTLTFIGSNKRVKQLLEDRFYTLMHKLCKKIKNNRFSKHGVWIEHFTVKEFDNFTRGHIHTILNVPDWISDDDFINIIQSIWNLVGDTRAGYINLKHKPKIFKSDLNSTDDALGYLLKEQTKDVNKDFSSFIIP